MAGSGDLDQFDMHAKHGGASHTGRRSRPDIRSTGSSSSQAGEAPSSDQALTPPCLLLLLLLLRAIDFRTAPSRRRL